MTTKEITYHQLSQAVRIAFQNDIQIISLYDPNVEINSIEDIVIDIPRKIKTFASAVLIGVYEKNELIGYFAYQGRILISFSIAVEYRQRKYLREFFYLINKELKKDFVCYLWKKNGRACKWLQKNGMEAYDFADHIVKFVCPIKESVNN